MSIDKKSFEDIIAPGEFWFLFFIGEIKYDNGKLSVDYWFINCNFKYHRPNYLTKKGWLKNYNREFIVTKTFSISSLSSSSIYSTGNILNKLGYLAAVPSDYIKKTLNINIGRRYQIVKNQSSQISSTDLFPFLRRDLLINNNYYKKTRTIKDNKKVIVIIPIIVFFKYFFFRSGKLTKAILSPDFDSNFKFENITNSNGSFYFNNNKIDDADAAHIGRFFFTLGGRGKRVLNNAYHLLLDKPINGKYGFAIPFETDLTFELFGDFINTKNQTYFYAFSIKSSNKINDNDLLYSIKENPTCIPQHRREKTKSIDSEDGIEYEQNIVETTKLSSDFTTEKPPDNIPIETIEGAKNFFFSDEMFSIKEKRESQENNWTQTGTNVIAHPEIRTINDNSDMIEDSDIEALETNYTVEDNTAWDQYLIDVLNKINEIKKENLKFEIVEPEKGFNFFYNPESNRYIQVIKINYNSNLLYLFEIQPINKGNNSYFKYTGIFSDINLKEISIKKIITLLLKAGGQDINFYWTEITDSFYRGLDIHKYPSLQHKVKNNYEAVIKETAERLYSKLKQILFNKF